MVDLLPHQKARLEEIRRDGAAAPLTLRRKIRRIKPVEALFVSLCKSPAARSSKLVARAAPDGAEGERVELATPIVRVDKARRLVYAQAYNAPWDPVDGSTVEAADFVRYVDAWDTFMTSDDVVACAHRFLAVSRAIDCEHDGIGGRAVVVESFVAGDGWAPWEPGAWVLGCHVPGDAEWARVEAGLADPDAEGALTGYSIQILALSEERTVDVKLDNVKRTAAPDAEPELSPADKLSLGKRILRALGFGADEVAAIERAAPAPAPTDEKRAESEPATDFASAWIANQASEDLSNVLWTLRAVLANILASKTITDKVAAISTSFDAARATYVVILAKAVAAVSEKRTADGATPELAHDDLRAILALDDGLDIIARVGRKMSKARLAKLKAAAAELRAVLDEVDDETDDAEGDETMKSEDVKRAVIEGMKEGTADLLKALREQATGTPDKPADKPADEKRAADAPMTPEQVAAAIKEGVAAGTKALRDELEAIKRAAPAGSRPGDGGGDKGANGKGGGKGGWYDGVFVDHPAD